MRVVGVALQCYTPEPSLVVASGIRGQFVLGRGLEKWNLHIAIPPQISR